MRLALVALVLSPSLAMLSQQAKPNEARGLKGFTIPNEPAHPEPPAFSFRDPKFRVSFLVPAGWDSAGKDGVLSSFHREVRSAGRNLVLRSVSSINYNPWQVTTFAGAFFYYSVLPQSNAKDCAAFATSGGMKAQPSATFAGMPMHHGQDQHGGMCTEARDDVYTVLSGRACLRFDLVVNTTCPQDSGQIAMNPQQLDDVDKRLTGILDSVRINR